MITSTDFTPIQGAILILSIVALMVELIIVRDRYKGLLEIPCIILLIDYVAFYGWLLVTSPYDRNVSFLWSQLLRLHTIITVLILASYRIMDIIRKRNNG